MRWRRMEAHRTVAARAKGKKNRKRCENRTPERERERETVVRVGKSESVVYTVCCLVGLVFLPFFSLYSNQNVNEFWKITVVSQYINVFVFIFLMHLYIIYLSYFVFGLIFLNIPIIFITINFYFTTNYTLQLSFNICTLLIIKLIILRFFNKNIF